jgi:hypothetical protein
MGIFYLHHSLSVFLSQARARAASTLARVSSTSGSALRDSASSCVPPPRPVSTRVPSPSLPCTDLGKQALELAHVLARLVLVAKVQQRDGVVELKDVVAAQPAPQSALTAQGRRPHLSSSTALLYA